MTIQPLSLEQTSALIEIVEEDDLESVRDLLEQFIIDYGYDESTEDYFTYDHQIISYVHRSLGEPKEG